MKDERLRDFSFAAERGNGGLDRLLDHIYQTRGIDFSSYRRATIQRKMQLRLEETSSASYNQYLAYLRDHPDEIDNLVRTLTIKVSNFFRNPLIHEILSSRVLPELLSEFGFLKVWSVGCATGEEAYSVAMMIHHKLRSERNFVEVKILGTDIDGEALDRARTGEYPEDELTEVKKKYLDAYFQVKPSPSLPHRESKNVFVVSNEIRAMVKFSQEDVVQWMEKKQGEDDFFNLILCRNVLIYMNRNIQDKILSCLSGSLYEKGVLVLGMTESPPSQFMKVMTQVFPGTKIYRKVVQSRVTPI